MNLFSSLLIEIFSLLPFVLLCIATQLINYKVSKRQYQFPMPVIALLYCICVSIVIRTDGIIVAIVAEVIPVLDGFATHLGVYAVNVIALAVFIIIKVFILHIGGNIYKLIAKVKASYNNADLQQDVNNEKKENIIVRICKKLVDVFYYHSKKYDNVILLRNKWTQYKLFFKYIYWGMTAFSVLVILISYHLYVRQVLAYPISPVYFVIVIGEIAAFLGGLTEVEFEEKNGVENLNAEPRYSELIPVYKEKFKERVMDTQVIPPIETKEQIDKDVKKVIDRLLESSDDDNRLLAKYIKNCIGRGLEPEVNYIKAAARLNKGKSVIFMTPFYNDLNTYIFFPCSRNLLRYKKTLVIVGRNSIEGDIQNWVDKGLAHISGIPSLWEGFILDSVTNGGDIGILPYYNINNIDIINSNREFFKEVGFVIIIEPSKILATAQIGLSNIVENLNSPIYCAIDKLNEGLLDALAHILRVSIEEVSASAICRGEVTRACIKADGDSLHYNMLSENTISRYLGVGTELAVEAVKFGVSKTNWCSYSNFPVVDMSIIDKEYYNILCQYMNVPINQSSFEDAVDFNINIWNVPKGKNAFIIAEDEECNMYEVVRQYGTRGNDQSFVAVISPDYILREYMESNSYLFENDAKAIPTIVPDYTRSVHNLVIKLIMALRYGPVKEETVRLQLKIMGEEIPENKTLVEFINEYIEKYFDGISVYPEQIIENKDDIINRRKVDAIAVNEIDYAFSVLKNTYYVAEDETEDSHYLGGKLLGHIYQMYLPGQFIVLAGKNYEVLSITDKRGMIVRRAEAHIDGRSYYRQIRSYHIAHLKESSSIASVKKINGIKISRLTADINVKTEGYLELSEYSDIKHARWIELNKIPDRNYKHKSILAIKFPDIKGSKENSGIDKKLCYTLAVIISEILRTMFPDNYQYLAVVTPFDTDGESDETIEVLRGINYSVCGETEENCIYIIEDSEPDLGLIAAFNRNFRRILGIVTDFLMWMTMEKDVRLSCDNDDTEGMKKVINFSLNVLANYGLGQVSFLNVAEGIFKCSIDQIVGDVVGSLSEKATDIIVDEIIAPGSKIIKAPVRDNDDDKDNMYCRYMKFGYKNVPDVFDLEKLYAYMLYFGFADSLLVRLRISKVFKKEIEDLKKEKPESKTDMEKTTLSTTVLENITDSTHSETEEIAEINSVSNETDAIAEAAATIETED